MSEFTIKCSLGSLRCSQRLRTQIETVVDRFHALVLRGSLIATETALRELRAGNVPHVNSHSWWNRCFTACGSTRGRRAPCADASIETSFQHLFSSTPPVVMDYMWSFIAQQGKDMVTATENMMVANFHVQIQKAFKREILISAFLADTVQTKESKQTTFKLVQHYTRKLLGHRDQTPRPEAPAEVLDSLEALCRTWQRDYANVLPCPTYAYILKNSDRVDRVRCASGCMIYRFTGSTAYNMYKREFHNPKTASKVFYKLRRHSPGGLL